MTNLNILYYLSKLIKKINIPAIKSSDYHSTSKICSASHVVDCTIDRYTYIGNNCTVIDTSIGGFTSIADNCIIGGASHPINWVSTSPVFYKGKNVLRKNFSKHDYKPFKHTTIGNDVWIGNNVLIKSGVSIGNGSIIGMGSVVTKNIGEYEIWAGNPARFIRKRFNDDQINLLSKTKWWKMSDKELENKSKYFNSIDQATKILKEEIE